MVQQMKITASRAMLHTLDIKECWRLNFGKPVLERIIALGGNLIGNFRHDQVVVSKYRRNAWSELSDLASFNEYIKFSNNTSP